MAMRVTIYTKPGCHLCEDALVLLDRLTLLYDLRVTEVNILDDMSLYEAYGTRIPVISIEDGRLGSLDAPIDEATLRTAFDIARRAPSSENPDRRGPGGRPGAGTGSSAKSTVAAYRENWLDRFARFIGLHWLGMASVALGLFVGLPWLAPVFAALGWWNLADPIYTAYAFQCHQLPERTAHIFGYEVASCMRCNALYGGMLLFGVLYGLARNRNVGWLQWLRNPLPVWAFVIMMLPILVDGVTHMLGLREASGEGFYGDFYLGSQVGSLSWWLRVATGLLAALAAVWFAAPRMDRTVEESESLRIMYAYSKERAAAS